MKYVVGTGRQVNGSVSRGLPMVFRRRGDIECDRVQAAEMAVFERSLFMVSLGTVML